LTARPRQRRARSALERWRWRIEIRRREFLGAAALFFFAPGRALAAEADRAESDAVVRALCDRIVPKHGAHPGALALGVDRRVLEWFERQPRRSRALAAAGDELRELSFERLSAGGRDAILARYLDPANDAPAARVLVVLRNAAVVYYFSSEASWKAIGYTQPQPNGYPDYARCRAGGGADAPGA